jgi:hypothetical protein
MHCVSTSGAKPDNKRNFSVETLHATSLHQARQYPRRFAAHRTIGAICERDSSGTTRQREAWRVMERIARRERGQSPREAARPKKSHKKKTRYNTAARLRDIIKQPYIINLDLNFIA